MRRGFSVTQAGSARNEPDNRQRIVTDPVIEQHCIARQPGNDAGNFRLIAFAVLDRSCARQLDQAEDVRRIRIRLLRELADQKIVDLTFIPKEAVSKTAWTGAAKVLDDRDSVPQERGFALRIFIPPREQCQPVKRLPFFLARVQRIGARRHFPEVSSRIGEPTHEEHRFRTIELRLQSTPLVTGDPRHFECTVKTGEGSRKLREIEGLRDANITENGNLSPAQLVLPVDVLSGPVGFDSLDRIAEAAVERSHIPQQLRALLRLECGARRLHSGVSIECALILPEALVERGEIGGGQLLPRRVPWFIGRSSYHAHGRLVTVQSLGIASFEIENVSDVVEPGDLRCPVMRSARYPECSFGIAEGCGIFASIRVSESCDRGCETFPGGVEGVVE